MEDFFGGAYYFILIPQNIIKSKMIERKFTSEREIFLLIFINPFSQVESQKLYT